MIALIPARGGSKGIPRKNIRPLAGKSLVRRAIDVALEVFPPDDVFVSTEDEEIAMEAGPFWLERPKKLAQDETPMVDVVKHAITAADLHRDDLIVLLQPSSPLRRTERIRDAVKTYRWGWSDSVVSVRKIPDEFHPAYAWTLYGRGSTAQMRLNGESLPTRRQDLEPRYVCEGSFYIFGAANIVRGRDMLGERVTPVVLPDDEVLNLNTEADWQEAERRLLVTAEACLACGDVRHGHGECR